MARSDARYCRRTSPNHHEFPRPGPERRGATMTTQTKYWPDAQVPAEFVYVGSDSTRADIYLFGDEILAVEKSGKLIRKLDFVLEYEGEAWKEAAALIRAHQA